MQNAGYWIHWSSYRNICTREMMNQVVLPCLPNLQPRAEWCWGQFCGVDWWENVLRRWVSCCCSFGVMGCPPSSYSRSSRLPSTPLSAWFWEGVQERACPVSAALPSHTRLCTPPASCPQKKGLLMFVWQPSAAPGTASFAKEVHHPSAPREDPPPREPDSGGFTALSWDTRF